MSRRPLCKLASMNRAGEGLSNCSDDFRAHIAISAGAGKAFLPYPFIKINHFIEFHVTPDYEWSTSKSSTWRLAFDRFGGGSRGGMPRNILLSATAVDAMVARIVPRSDGFPRRLDHSPDTPIHYPSRGIHMKILVCMKQVPQKDAPLKLNEAGTWIREDVSYEVNEPDAYALEEALRQKEKHGGEVVVVAVGPARSQQVLREAWPRAPTAPFMLSTIHSLRSIP